MKKIYDDVSIKCSKLTTRSYSTSFSMGIKFLNSRFQNPIYAIYGFVRFADEIVDTFHDYNKLDLLMRFKQDTYNAINEKISLNPILNSFQKVVHDYSINIELVDAFLESMQMDLEKKAYDQDGYEKYILGSAEVVGLMCLKVFTENNGTLYKSLESHAMKLGSAFQKINFLRDLKSDYHDLGRVYFPGVDMAQFNASAKKEIEKNIEIDFKDGYEGIKKLPKDARFGVYVAYVYYYRLFKKIKGLPAEKILNERVRIPNNKKYGLFLGSYVKHSLNLL
ncbi:MAG TPA: phytoene/squalene synthase family protein [Flavobacteriales bacterium]|nr:phytoene/squalene synthase family protein [Flavobacteriales bacterium]